MPETGGLISEELEDQMPDLTQRRQAALDEAGGILVVDKPEGVTSTRLSTQVKNILKPGKIGHTGTLDPFATGVMVLCINEATRVADQFINYGKVYLATLRFGVETDTLDKTGNVVKTSDVRFCERDLVESLESFRGECTQKVPKFSAVKIGGQRLYKLSRKGIEVQVPEREVCIHSIALHSFEWPEAVVEISCSKGTYIRQIASDLGEKLGSGAHLSALRRLSVGPFKVESALNIDELSMENRDRIVSRIIPVNDAISHLPAVTLGDEQILARLKFGQLDRGWASAHSGVFARDAGPVRIVTVSNRLAALWWPKPAAAGSRSLRVFTY